MAWCCKKFRRTDRAGETRRPSQAPKIWSVEHPVVIIAGYKFVPLQDWPSLRGCLLDSASAARLRGTVLLAEGILGYFAATRGAAPGWQGHCFVFDEWFDERFDERGTLGACLRA